MARVDEQVHSNGSDTRVARTQSALRADILAGDWMPSSRLQVTRLSEYYETSSTVIREALTRLTGERLVELKPHRGFYVPLLSLDRLRDFSELRCLTEEFGVRLAMERGTVEWESRVVATHHKLERTRYYDSNGWNSANREWEAVHAEFHRTLISACDIPALIDLTEALSDETYLYQRWIAPSPSTKGRDIHIEHRAILDATVKRDGALAGRLLVDHYRQTTRRILSAGLLPGVSEDR